MLGSKGQAIVGGGMGVETHFPELIKPTAGANAAEGHARLLAASADDGLASGFDDSRTDEEAPAAESTILHAVCVADKVTQLLLHRLGSGGAGALFARGGDELFDLIPE